MLWLWLLRLLQGWCRHPDTITMSIDSAPTYMEYCRCCGARRWIWPREHYDAYGLWQQPSGAMRGGQRMAVAWGEDRKRAKLAAAPAPPQETDQCD